MADLTTLRALFYVYLGTVSTDPAYPQTTADVLLNAAARELAADMQQMAPDMLQKVVTLNPDVAGGSTYTLPSDFYEALEVRLGTNLGTPLEEVRSEELDLGWDGPVFAIYGPDATATLEVSDLAEPGSPLYFRYGYQPVDLAAPSDIPSWMPTQFHDLIARAAAIDAYGLGAEAAPAPEFLEKTEDRKGQYWFHLSRRTTQAQTPRQTR